MLKGIAHTEEELGKLTERLDKASTAYRMEISAEKAKLMTSNPRGINTEMNVNGRKLETVISFKYLGSVVIDESSKPETLSRMSQTIAALTRLKPVWMAGVCLSVPRNDWYAPLSHSSSCMLVNHGRLPQSFKEKYKPWKWGATARYYAFFTKTTSPTRKSMPWPQEDLLTIVKRRKQQ